MRYSIGLVLFVAVTSTMGYPLENEYKLAVNLHDFAKLLSREQVIAITLDYVHNDEEVQRFVSFALSDKMKAFMLDLEGIPDYQNVLKLIQTQGIDIYGVLGALHDFMDMPSYVPPPNYLKAKVNAPGISGLFQTIEALMPLDKIEALKHEKLETSPEYKTFYDLVTSSEYRRLTCTLEANSDFQRILANAESDAFYPFVIRHFIYRLVGIRSYTC